MPEMTEIMNSKVKMLEENCMHQIEGMYMCYEVAGHILKFFDTFVCNFYAKLHMACKVTIFAIGLPNKHCNFCHLLPTHQYGFQNQSFTYPSLEIVGKRDGLQPPSDFKDRYVFKFCWWTYNHTVSKPNP